MGKFMQEHPLLTFIIATSAIGAIQTIGVEFAKSFHSDAYWEVEKIKAMNDGILNLNDKSPEYNVSIGE